MLDNVNLVLTHTQVTHLALMNFQERKVLRFGDRAGDCPVRARTESTVLGDQLIMIYGTYHDIYRY